MGRAGAGAAGGDHRQNCGGGRRCGADFLRRGDALCPELAGLGLILRVDGGATSLGGGGGQGATFFGVEEALRLGADAVAVSAFPGSPVEVESLERLAHVIVAAHQWGLPVMAEMVPGGFDSPPDKRTPHAIALAVRVAAELGADFVKTPYCAGFAQGDRRLLRAGRGAGWGEARQ
jgi:hypothetical protein